MCVILQDGESALMNGAWMGRTEVVAELVKGGADLNLQNKVFLFMHYIHHIMCMLY